MLPIAYAIYVIASVAIAVWVGKTLHKNGRVFLVQNFKGNTELADSVNDLLLVGFYLVNFGFICLALKYGEKTETLAGMIEFLSTKIGLVILVLGGMHFFNMFALAKYKKFDAGSSTQA